MLRMLIGCLGMLLVSQVALAEPPDGYPFVSFDAGLRLAKEQKRPIFLYFGRFGCGWCDKTNKEAFSDPGLRKLYTKNYVLRVNSPPPSFCPAESTPRFWPRRYRYPPPPPECP